METKCVICGKNIPFNATILIVGYDEKLGDYKMCCLSHQNSKELKDFMERDD